MHELSLAVNIIEIAESSAKAEYCTNISFIELEVGSLSGVEISALEIAMQSAIKDTMLQNAKIKITEIKAEVKCLECASHFVIENRYDPCPNCNSFHHEIINGNELKVKSIEAE